MSYLVLARKYRPKDFADLVGQEVIARTLQGAIEEQRVGHAYLFSGPRGTGKTTTARILAKALNCVTGPTANPCGVCDHCTAIDRGADPDLIEMDAASNRRIEDVRELRENVAYAPMRARFKIYIVDEVHMMTKEAFNALLKTLEEPPKHVKFLLATTDPQKVPATILSRCQILRLSPLPEAVIAARLEHVFAAENVVAESGVAHEIARRARGGMRDALSMADQLLSLVGSAPKVADLERLSAEGGADRADRILACLAAADRAGVIEALPEGEGSEVDIVGALLDRLRAMLVVALLGPATPLVQLEAVERTTLAERAERIGLPRIEAWIEELVLARERMARLASHGRVLLEVALLDMARPESSISFAELERRLVALESRLQGLPVVAPTARPSAATPLANAATSAPTNVPRPVDDFVPRRAPPATERAPAPAFSASAPSASAPSASASSSSASSSSAPSASAPSASAPSASASSLSAPSSSASNAPTQPSRAARSAPTDSASPSGASTPRVVPSETRSEDAFLSDAPRPRIAGNADAWDRFLEALAKSSASLAETLRLRGKLVDLTNGRALVQLANLREAERVAVTDSANQKKCSSVFSAVVGTPTSVVIEDQSVAKKSRDAYTGKVAELFGGRIEDDG